MIFGITYFYLFILVLFSTVIFVVLKAVLYNPRKHSQNKLKKVVKALTDIKPAKRNVAEFPDVPREAVILSFNAVQLIASNLKKNNPEKFNDLRARTSDLVAAWALTYTDYKDYNLQGFKIHAGANGLNVIILTEALLLQDGFAARKSIRGVEDLKLKKVFEDLIQEL